MTFFCFFERFIPFFEGENYRAISSNLATFADIFPVDLPIRSAIIPKLEIFLNSFNSYSGCNGRCCFAGYKKFFKPILDERRVHPSTVKREFCWYCWMDARVGLWDRS